MSYKCPYCESDLNYHDYYGTGIPGLTPFEKRGEVYKCENQECDSEVFNYHFHTDKDGDLKEGYPC